MATPDYDFWKRAVDAAPGMLGVAGNIYGATQMPKEVDKRIAAASAGPYQQASALSQTALTRAGSMDPEAAAKERFDMQQRLLAGQDASDEAALWRSLQNKGVIGMGTYDTAARDPQGNILTSWQPGAGPVNPIAAAHYAAQNQRRSQSAWDAMREGEAQIDRQLQRSQQLQTQAQAARAANLGVEGMRPSRVGRNQQVLGGLGSLLKNKEVMKDVGGLFGKGLNWLGNTTGWWGSGSSAAFGADPMGLVLGADDYRWDMD